VNKRNEGHLTLGYNNKANTKVSLKHQKLSYSEISSESWQTSY